MSKSVIIIPSRLAATRLPNKPLLKINNKTIVMHVYERAIKSNIGEVYVATSDSEIYEEVIKNNGKCIITNSSHKTGTDRIAEALNKIKEEDIEYVVNLQGDEPMIDIEDINNLNKQANKIKSKIATLACPIKEPSFYKKESIVKVITKNEIDYNKSSKAQNFFRTISKEDYPNIYHHIGIYIFQKEILNQYVSLEQSQEEKKKKLEQIRALDNNIEIDVILAKSSPLGVDTREDYIEIKKLMEYKV